MTVTVETENHMSEAVAAHFKNSVREVPVGNCILDVVAYDKEEKLFHVIECKLGFDATSIGHAFGQIETYAAVISGSPKSFIDSYTDRFPLRYRRIMEATDDNHQIRIAFHVALVDKACANTDLIRSLKHRLPNIGIIRVKDNGKCRNYLRTAGEKNSELARATPVAIKI